jgi:hypothetical protein
MSRAAILADKVKPMYPKHYWPFMSEKILIAIMKQIITQKTRVYINHEEMKCLKLGATLEYKAMLNLIDTFEQANQETPTEEVGMITDVCSGVPISLEHNVTVNKVSPVDNEVTDRLAQMEKSLAEITLAAADFQRQNAKDMSRGNRDRSRPSRERPISQSLLNQLNAAKESEKLEYKGNNYNPFKSSQSQSQSRDTSRTRSFSYNPKTHQAGRGYDRMKDRKYEDQKDREERIRLMRSLSRNRDSSQRSYSQNFSGSQNRSYESKPFSQTQMRNPNYKGNNYNPNYRRFSNQSQSSFKPNSTPYSQRSQSASLSSNSQNNRQAYGRNSYNSQSNNRNFTDRRNYNPNFKSFYSNNFKQQGYNPNFRGNNFNPNFRQNNTRSWDGNFRKPSWNSNQNSFNASWQTNQTEPNYQSGNRQNYQNYQKPKEKDGNTVQFTLNDVQYCKCKNTNCKSLHPTSTPCPLKEDKDQQRKN